MYNFMAAVVDHSLLFSDAFGGVQRLHLANGTALWSLPALSDDQMSTGGQIYWEKLKVDPQKNQGAKESIDCRALGNQMSKFTTFGSFSGRQELGL